MRSELTRWDALVSSALLEVEVIRACARHGDEDVHRAEQAGLAVDSPA